VIVDGYVRVSQVAGRSGERFISPKVQREQIEAWALLNGAAVGEIFEELDESGSRADRPLLEEAIRRIEAGESNGLVVAYLSRFGRSLMNGMVAIKRITDAQGTFVSIQEGLDFSTDTGRLILRFMLSIGEWELDRFRSNWRVASERAVGRGVFQGGVPFGYSRGRDTRLRVDPREGPVVTELFRRRVAGAQYAELTRWLRQCGVPPKMGGVWGYGRADEMIRMRVYLGESRYLDVVNPAAHPPLIDVETWERAQFRGIRVPRTRQEAPLLWGLLRCASCQRVLITSSENLGTSTGQRYYRCYTNQTSKTCPASPQVHDTVIEPYIEQLFWQELPKLQRAPKAARLTRLQATLERRTDELASYRDSPRLPVTLGEQRFSEGIATRARRVELAQLDLLRAQHAAGSPSVLPVAKLQERWGSMDVAERRAAMGQVIDCAFVWGGQGHIEPRVHVFLRGRGPLGLPALGQRSDPLPPFDPSAFPPPVRLRAVPYWEMSRIQAELETFTAGKEMWPSFPDFQAAGRALLHEQAKTNGGVRQWAAKLGLRYVVGSPGGGKWTDDIIRTALTDALRGRNRWPTWVEFRAAGHEKLRLAVAATGGSVRWAAELGVELPPNQRPIHRRWAYPAMKAAVAEIVTPDRHWPTHKEFHAAGLSGLAQVMTRQLLRERIADDLGLSRPPTRTIRTRCWTPDLIRAELDQFLAGRDSWPVASEFSQAGLGGLRTSMSRKRTIDWWAAQYGLVVRHAPGPAPS
jgi:DNA invertase Pin-like site-specific DNA recombinase